MSNYRGGIDELLRDLVKAGLDLPISALLRIRVYEQGFEDGTSDLIASGVTQVVQNTEVYDGNNALQVTVPAGTTGYVETPTRPVSPYQRVTFTFAHKEDANISSIKLVVVWYSVNGRVIDTEEFELTPSTSWQLDSRTVTAPKNSAYMALRIEATAGASDGNVYLDDMFMDLVGQILRVDSSGQLKVANTDLLDTLKSTRASPTQQLSGASIDPGGTHEFTLSDLDTYSAVVVTVKAAYDPSASVGVRVRWLYSMDGVNFDSPEDAEDQGNYEDLTFSAGATRQRSVLIPIFAPYVKIQIVNKDSSYGVTVDVWYTLMR